MNKYNEYSEQLERYEQVASEGGYRQLGLLMLETAYNFTP